MDLSILLATNMIVARRGDGLARKRSDDPLYLGNFEWAASDCDHVLVRLAAALVIGALLLGVLTVL